MKAKGEVAVEAIEPTGRFANVAGRWTRWPWTGIAGLALSVGLLLAGWWGIGERRVSTWAEVAALLGALGVLVLTVMLVMHRATPGGIFARSARPMRLRVCSRCGYDISGLDRESVCPECGTPREDDLEA